MFCRSCYDVDNDYNSNDDDNDNDSNSNDSDDNSNANALNANNIPLNLSPSAASAFATNFHRIEAHVLNATTLFIASIPGIESIPLRLREELHFLFNVSRKQPYNQFCWKAGVALNEEPSAWWSSITRHP